MRFWPYETLEIVVHTSLQAVQTALQQTIAPASWSATYDPEPSFQGKFSGNSVRFRRRTPSVFLFDPTLYVAPAFEMQMIGSGDRTALNMKALPYRFSHVFLMVWLILFCGGTLFLLFQAMRNGISLAGILTCIVMLLIASGILLACRKSHLKWTRRHQDEFLDQLALNLPNGTLIEKRHLP